MTPPPLKFSLDPSPPPKIFGRDHVILVTDGKVGIGKNRFGIVQYQSRNFVQQPNIPGLIATLSDHVDS
jgi:hypothetical protein